MSTPATCFGNKCGHGAPTGLHLYRETSPVFSGSVLAMTLMLLTEENEMFITHQYDWDILNWDFAWAYLMSPCDGSDLYTYMNL